MNMKKHTRSLSRQMSWGGLSSQQEKEVDLMNADWWSENGISLEWLVQTHGKFVRNELAKDFTIACVQSEVQPGKTKMFDLALKKGETILVTDSKQYPNWKGQKVNGKKGNVSAQVLKVKQRNGWTFQDFVDFALEVKKSKTAFVESLEEVEAVNNSDSSKKFGVVIGYSTLLDEVISALKEQFAGQNLKEVILWFDCFGISPKASREKETSFWTNTPILKGLFSETLIVFDAVGPKPPRSLGNVLGLWQMSHCENCTLALSAEKRTEFMSVLKTSFDQMYRWISNLRIDKDDEESLTDLEMAIEEKARQESGISTVNTKIRNTVIRWFAERSKSSFERLAIKIPLGTETPLDESMVVQACQTLQFGSNVSNLYKNLDDMQNASDVLEKCCDISRAVNEDSMETCHLLLEFSKCCNALNDTDRSIQNLELCESILMKNKETFEAGSEKQVCRLTLCEALSSLAEAMELSGGKKVTLAVLEKLLPIQEETFGLEHQSVMETLQRMANLEIELNQGSKATLYAVKALEMSKSLNGEKNPKTASSLLLLGRALKLQSREAEALKFLEQGMDLRKLTFGEKDKDVVDAMSQIRMLKISLEKEKEKKKQSVESNGDAKAGAEAEAGVIQKQTSE